MSQVHIDIPIRAITSITIKPSGSVTDIPETTFNNMHGRINDLRTKDANTFAARQLNEIGWFLLAKIVLRHHVLSLCDTSLSQV